MFEEPSVGEQAQQQIIAKTQKGDLFDNKERLEEVKSLSAQHRFFHNQLEFIEVFKERGGFDLINGNPPWLKITFEAKSIISERRPEVEIHDYDANGVDEILEELLESDGDLKELYIREYNEMESTSTFLNGFQNYPLLKGQQTNLYKCILSNTFNITSENGFIGLLHPETIFDDPKGQDFRREIYPRLKYYFRFQNALNLFPEVGHRKKYCSVIYSGSKSDIAFKALNNLFHPSTIDSSFTHNGLGLAEGIKVKDEKTGKFDWNLKGHKDRIVNISIKQLKLFSELFEGGVESESCKLVSFHADSMVAILEVLNSFPIKVAAHEYKTSECLHETNAIKKLKIIKKETKFPIIDDYELIYSGPHFYVAQPIYKTPREKCTEKGHYDIIDLSSIDEEFLPRTNYVPSVEIDKFLSNLDEFDGRNWNDYFKLGWSKMLNLEGERTLQGAILAPKVAHINGLISIIFKSQSELIEFAGLNSSLVFDFFIKTIGASNLTDSRIKALPIDIENHYKPYLFSRTLRLNCLTSLYRELWECNFNKQFSNDSWSKRDGRLADFNELEDKWNNTTPLRNYFERRQALVEIDVIVAISIGLRLEDLIKMYKFQFPVLQQNEDDTWYDNTGNIVFTCSKGLTGVGVDRPVWNTIKDLKAGETYEHTIIEK